MMFLIKRFNLGLVLMLFCILLSACGPSPEELASTSAAEIAATATSTPTISPTFTPTPTQVPPTATATSTSTPVPLLCEGVEGNCVEFRFQPDKCRRVGPEIVPAGKITLIFSNYTSYDAGIDLEILDEGKTFKDMLRYMGGLHVYAGSPPEWSVDVAGGDMRPGQYEESQEELTAGIYIAVCGTISPHRVWLANGVLVVED